MQKRTLLNSLVLLILLSSFIFWAGGLAYAEADFCALPEKCTAACGQMCSIKESSKDEVGQVLKALPWKYSLPDDSCFGPQDVSVVPDQGVATSNSPYAAETLKKLTLVLNYTGWIRATVKGSTCSEEAAPENKVNPPLKICSLPLACKPACGRTCEYRVPAKNQKKERLEIPSKVQFPEDACDSSQELEFVKSSAKSKNLDSQLSEAPSEIKMIYRYLKFIKNTKVGKSCKPAESERSDLNKSSSKEEDTGGALEKPASGAGGGGANAVAEVGPKVDKAIDSSSKPGAKPEATPIPCKPDRVTCETYAIAAGGKPPCIETGWSEDCCEKVQAKINSWFVSTFISHRARVEGLFGLQKAGCDGNSFNPQKGFRSDLAWTYQETFSDKELCDSKKRHKRVFTAELFCKEK